MENRLTASEARSFITSNNLLKCVLNQIKDTACSGYSHLVYPLYDIDPSAVDKIENELKGLGYEVKICKTSNQRVIGEGNSKVEFLEINYSLVVYW